MIGLRELWRRKLTFGLIAAVVALVSYDLRPAAPTRLDRATVSEQSMLDKSDQGRVTTTAPGSRYSARGARDLRRRSS